MGSLCGKSADSSGGGVSSEYNKKFVSSQMNVKDLKAKYDIDHNVLGAGAFGKVFKA